MNIRIHAPWQVNQHIRKTIEEKINKLEQFYHRTEFADVYLKITDHAHTTENKLIEARLKVPGKTLFAESCKDAFEKGVAECYDKLKVQLLKIKEKRADR